MENNLQTKYEIYGLPQSITILNKKYTYKSNLKTADFATFFLY